MPAVKQDQCRMDDPSCCMDDPSWRVDDLPCRMDDLSCRVDDLTCRVDDLTCRVEDLTCRMDDLTCRMEDLSYRMEDLPYPVEDLPRQVESTEYQRFGAEMRDCRLRTCAQPSCRVADCNESHDQRTPPCLQVVRLAAPCHLLASHSTFVTFLPCRPCISSLNQIKPCRVRYQ